MQSPLKIHSVWYALYYQSLMWASFALFVVALWAYLHDGDIQRAIFLALVAILLKQEGEGVCFEQTQTGVFEWTKRKGA